MLGGQFHLARSGNTNYIFEAAVARAAIDFDAKPPLSAILHKDATGNAIGL